MFTLYLFDHDTDQNIMYFISKYFQINNFKI